MQMLYLIVGLSAVLGASEMRRGQAAIELSSPEVQVDKCHGVCDKHHKLQRQNKTLSKFFSHAEKWGSQAPSDTNGTQTEKKVHNIGFEKLMENFKRDFEKIQESAPKLKSMHFRSNHSKSNATRTHAKIKGEKAGSGAEPNPLDSIDDMDFPWWVDRGIPAVGSSFSPISPELVAPAWNPAMSALCQPDWNTWCGHLPPGFGTMPGLPELLPMQSLGNFYWPFMTNLQTEISRQLDSVHDDFIDCSCALIEPPFRGTYIADQGDFIA